MRLPLFVAITAGCALLVPWTGAHAAEQDGSAPPAALRWWGGMEGRQWAPAEIYDHAWEIVRRRFYDEDMNGINWADAGDRHRAAAAEAEDSAELSRAINALLAELDTSHMGHFTADDVEYYHLLDIMFGGDGEVRGPLRTRFPSGFRYEGIEAWLQGDESGLLVRSVWPGGNAERAGLLAGDVILSIDGETPAPVASFRGKAGRPVELSVQREPEGEAQIIAFTPGWIYPRAALLGAMRSSVRIVEVDQARIGYIQILSYAGEQYQQLLLDEIFGDGRLAGADALIIDIRGGWGGAQSEYLNPFLDAPVVEMRSRGEQARAASSRWKKPVCMIIDGATRSGKEILAYGFREYDIGPLIGERTAGAVVAGALSLLPDGSLLYLAVADVRVDDMRLEAVGVEPTIHVPFERRLSGGADPQLEAAIAAMRTKVAEERSRGK